MPLQALQMASSNSSLSSRASTSKTSCETFWQALQRYGTRTDAMREAYAVSGRSEAYSTSGIGQHWMSNVDSLASVFRKRTQERTPIELTLVIPPQSKTTWLPASVGAR